MFKTREEELILRKHRYQQLLKMFRDVLTRISKLKQSKLHVTASAMFQGDEFNFDIIVFNGARGTNTSCTIYDFWEVKKSQKLVDTFMAAIKTGNFEKVKAVKCFP